MILSKERQSIGQTVACCYLLAAGLLTIDGAAAQVMINPVLIELGQRQKIVAVSVTLSPSAKAPMRLQAEVLRWSQDLQGRTVNDSTDDLLVTPPIADLKPGVTQMFRLMLRGPRPAQEELAYRLILEDVGEPVPGSDGAPAMAINFRMRYDLPVFIAPAESLQTALRWKFCPNDALSKLPALHGKPPAGGDSEVCVRVNNAGNRRVKVQNLTLAGNGWQHSVPFKEGINVLSGAEREWRIPLQAGQTGALQSVQVFTARGETIDAQAGGF